MGITIMANVKASSFKMTSLRRVSGAKSFQDGRDGAPHMGTAGLMSDLSPAAGLAPTVSSLSRMVFSVEMILRVAMLTTGFGHNWKGGCVWTKGHTSTR